MPLKVLIVGAGITGLTTALCLDSKGHRATILERHPDIQNIGGPMSIRPAAVRALRQYGLGPVLDHNYEPDIGVWAHRRYTGELIARSVQGEQAGLYGEASVGFARPQLQEALMREAVGRGIEVRFGCHVVGVDDDPRSPGVRLADGTTLRADGTTLRADLVVGADGIGSNVRKAILDPEDNKIQSLLSAYLVRIPLEAVQADPELQPYLDQATWWIGPGAMCIATRLHHVGLFEVHFYVDKELGEPGVWDASGDIDDIRRDFAGWDPILLRMLGHAPSRRCWLWRVSGGAPLPTWISKGGRIVITGDASHAMVPYASQGASQGIEDAAVLAECVSREGADLTAVLKVFEKIRKGRAEAAVVCGATRKAIMHVPDGPAQEARDEQLRAGGSKGADSSGASWDPDAHDALPERGCSLMELDDYLMGHDALRYARKVLDQELPRAEVGNAAMRGPSAVSV